METIQEAADTREEASLSTSGTHIDQEVPNKVEQHDKTETTPKIPVLVEEIADELWQEVRDLKEKERVTNTSAPISLVGQTDYMVMDKMILTTNEIREDEDRVSKANTLAMSPPFL